MQDKRLQIAVQDSLSRRKLGTDSKLLSKNRGQKQSITTGFHNLDRLLKMEGFVVVVGQPGTCKSALILQVASYNVQKGLPVYWMDLENGKSETTDRLLANIYGQTIETLASQDDFDTKQGKLSELPLYYCDEALPFEKLDQEIAEVYEKHQSPLILVIDSLQSLPSNLGDIRMSVDAWLFNLTKLKLKYDKKLTIIIICEKKRGTYGEAALDAAKESGRIEYKAEQQLDLRPDVETGAIIMECTKNRFGPKGMQFKFDMVYADSTDPRSFVFRLKERETLEI